ncbi:MAG: hypothetical protein AB1458_13230 [Bacteroidota bacterium]
MKKYSHNTILALGNAILGDAEAENWLEQHGFPELVHLSDFILHETPGSYQYLADHNHLQLAAFCDAFKGNGKAMAWLLRTKNREWAATLKLALDEDYDARDWLMANEFSAFVYLAKCIERFIRMYNTHDDIAPI